MNRLSALFSVGIALFLGIVAPFVCFHGIDTYDAPHGPHLIFFVPESEHGAEHLHADRDTTPVGRGQPQWAATGIGAEIMMLGGLLVLLVFGRKLALPPLITIGSVSTSPSIPRQHTISPLDPPPRPALFLSA